MQSSFTHKSNPNPGKLIESLRCLGYDNYHAIADLVDNSLDASAKLVQVIVRTRNSETEIIIADNGIGMDSEILDQAIRLGSLVEKDSATDLGKFGMGLCTASLSLCRQTTVLTKAQDGELLKAVNDVDEVKKHNDFVSLFGKAEMEEQILFDELLPKASSGTILILRKCDNVQHSNLTVFSKTLAKQLARIFRYFIKAGTAISVNGEKLAAIDPLEWENSKTERFDEGKIEIEIKENGQFVRDVISVKLAVLPDDSATGDASIGVSLKSQGFYILRNNREVLDAVTFDLYTRHNDYNRFRGEIHFGGTLDKYMGVNFTKRNVSAHQSLQDQIRNYIVGQLKTIRDRIKKQQRIEMPADIEEVHKGVEDEIRRKSKLLMTPQAPKEKREPKGEKPPKPSLTLKETPKTREPREKRQAGGVAANCRFETSSMGEAGPIYAAEQQGRTIIVRWNIDHPFYQRFVLENLQDKRIVSAADFLIYSLACAELIWFNNEETTVLLDNLKQVISANMRTLLS
ncbi:MAG TPA: ATP-binding protein [Candidatus Acidoferrum sp.]|jgi:hypothetical protein|nr:ATP-binding protein [Candidatus Acidoferrum sp.]